MKKVASKYSDKITRLEKELSDWLGKDSRVLKNKSNDPIFMSKDGSRKIRFDFNNSHGDKPHMHIEKKLHKDWIDATGQHRIYPLD